MPDQIERILLVAEDRTGPAKTSANDNLQAIEDRAKRVGDAVTKSTEQVGQQVVAVTDRTRAQIDRAVSSAESRLNALKSPIERLEQMRNSSLNRVAGDPEAVDRVTAAYNRLIQAEKMTEAEAKAANLAAEQASQAKARAAAIELQNVEKLRRASIVDSAQRRVQTPLQNLTLDKERALAGVAGDPAAIRAVTASFDQLIRKETEQNSKAVQFGAVIKNAVQNPAGAAAGAVESLGGSFGVMGIAAAGAAVGLAAAAVGTFAIVSSSGKAAENISNLADRMGLTIEQSEKLSDVARIAGVDVGAFEGLARKLADTLTDGGPASDAAVRRFEKIGIKVNQQNGQFKNTLDILRELGTQINKLPEHNDQVKVLTDTVGRGAITYLPVIKNFADLEKQVDSLGPTLDRDLIKRLAAADDKLDRLGISYDRIKLKFAEKIVATIEFVTNNNDPNLRLMFAFMEKFLNPFGGGASIPRASGPQGPATPADILKANNSGVERGDALVGQFRNRLDPATLQRKLSQLESDRNDVAAKIQLGASDAVQRTNIARFDALSKTIEQTKTQIKDFAEIPEKVKEAHKLLVSTQADEASGLAKLSIERQNQLDLLGKTAAAANDINAAFDIRVRNEEKLQALQLKQGGAQNSLARLEGERDAALRAASPQSLDDIRRPAALEVQRAAIATDFARRAELLHEQQILDQAQFEIDKNKTALDAKLIDQVQFENERTRIGALASQKIEALRIQLSASSDVEIETARIRATVDTLTKTDALLRAAEDQRAAIEQQRLDISRDNRLQSLSAVRAVTVAEQISLENQRAAIEADYQTRAADLQVSNVQRAAQIEFDSLKDLLKNKLILDADYEKARAAIAAGEQLKIDEIRLGASAATNRAEQEAAIRSADIIRQKNQEIFDSYKAGVRGVLDDIVDRHENVFAAIGKALKNAFVNAIKDAAAAEIAGILTQLQTGIKTSTTAQSAGNGPLGKLLTALGLGGKTAKFGDKLEAPNHLGDVNLINGAVPVVIVGGQQQQSQQQELPLRRSSAIPGAVAAGLGALVGGSFSGAGTGATAVSQSISFPGQAAQSLGTTISGGTPPFVESTAGGAGGGAGGFGGALSGVKASLSKLGGLGGGAAHGGLGGAGGGLALLGGVTLAADGLRRGGLKGLAETTAGGALIGFKFGGPIGALIGGAIGAAAGAIRLLFKGKDQKIVDKVKAIYGITISSSFAKNPIGQMIDQNFGGDIEVGLRSPQIRDLLNLYAQSTGQTFPLANTPQAVSLAISNGVLQQQAAHVNGQAIAYGGGTAQLAGPVDRLITGQTAVQNGVPQTVTVQSLQLNLNGKSAAQALTGQIAASPDAVGQASIQSASRGTTRRALGIMQTAPGLLTS